MTKQITQADADADNDPLFPDSTLPTGRNPFDGMTEDEYNAQREQWKRPKRKRDPNAEPRKKPETKVKERVTDHLVKKYNAVITRVNSGFWRDDSGNVIMGAKTGTSDIIACVPITISGELMPDRGADLILGLYMAIETKAGKNTATDPQQRFLAKIRIRGGIDVVAYTILDIDRAIAEATARIAGRIVRR